MDSETCFKKCTNCGYVWEEREVFLSDPNVRIVGYQVNTKELLGGLILFNHGCQSTLALQVQLFIDLYFGFVYTEFKFEDDECPGHCIRRFDLQPCTHTCEGAYVREILQIVNKWPKTEMAEIV